MANTTFTGPVRSEGGFTSISKNTATGTITTLSSISSTGVASFDANTLATEAGTGITGGTGTVYKSSVQRTGGIITTTILIDLTGLRSTASGDIIGVNGTSNPCHIGQITAARNGTIIAGSMECFEAPAGGDRNIFFTAFPAADEFLYLTLGATTDADYTAGKLVITLIGTA